MLLIVAYGLGMLFSLKTHRESFAGAELRQTGRIAVAAGPGLRDAAGVTVLVALVSEIFVESVQKPAETFDMSRPLSGSLS